MITEDVKPELIDRAFVLAFRPEGNRRPGGGTAPKAGYLYVDLTSPEDAGQSYAYCAYPAEYDETGWQTFVIDQEGNVYGRDLGGKRVDVFPEDLSGWVSAGD